MYDYDYEKLHVEIEFEENLYEHKLYLESQLVNGDKVQNSRHFIEDLNSTFVIAKEKHEQHKTKVELIKQKVHENLSTLSTSVFMEIERGKVDLV